MLGLAATWRWRDHAWRGGLALGALIAIKLIFVPLIAWLLFTRRWACAAVAAASSAALCLAAWAAIGFDGFTDYPHVLSLLTQIEKTQGFSSGSYVLSLGLGDGIAKAMPYVARLLRDRPALARDPARRRARRRLRLPARDARGDRVLADRLAALPRAAAACRSPCCDRG